MCVPITRQTKLQKTFAVSKLLLNAWAHESVKKTKTTPLSISRCLRNLCKNIYCPLNVLSVFCFVRSVRVHFWFSIFLLECEDGSVLNSCRWKQKRIWMTATQIDLTLKYLQMGIRLFKNKIKMSSICLWSIFQNMPFPPSIFVQFGRRHIGFFVKFGML